MNCSDARQTLATAIPNELPHEQRHALVVHLDHCAACRRYRGVISDVDTLISAWGDATPVRGQVRTRAALQQRVRASRFRLRLRRLRRNPQRPLVLAGAATLCICFVIVWALGSATLPTSIRPSFVRSPSAVPAPNKVIVTGDDRVVLTCKTPFPGSELRDTTLNCVVDTTLASVDTAVLSMRLVGGQNNAQRFFADPVAMARGTSTTPIVASLDAQRLRATFGTGQVHLEAVLRASNG